MPVEPQVNQVGLSPGMDNVRLIVENLRDLRELQGKSRYSEERNSPGGELERTPVESQPLRILWFENGVLVRRNYL